MNDSLENKWQVLRSAEQNAVHDLGIPTMPLDVSTAYGTVRLAIGDVNQSRLLVPVDVSAPVPHNLETGGLRFSTIILTAGGNPTKFLDIVCLENRLNDVFIELTKDILRRISGGSGAISSVREAIAEFRRLVEKNRLHGLAKEEVLGLIGELLLLTRLLEINPGCLPVWMGPSCARHDFVNGQLAAEVKTAIRAHEPVVGIHAIDQLEAPPGGELYLIHYILEENKAGEISLEQLADKARTLAAEPGALAERLQAAGYFPAESNPLTQTRYSLQKSAHYHVTEGFPRLVPSAFCAGTVPTGVSHIQYRINLSYAQDFLCSADDEAKLMQGLSL